MDEHDSNPLREGLRLQRIPEPCIAVIFGASGDLTRRKLVPALYSLSIQNLLPPGFTIVGVARTAMSDEDFRKQMKEAIEKYSEAGIQNEADWQNFQAGLFYHTTDLTKPEHVKSLVDLLKRVDQERGTEGNRLFYLATPPDFYDEAIQMIGENKLNHPEAGGWTRIIIEKPFGHDLESARALNRMALQVFHEDQIYRIDHYLGKETVQNLMVLRFANAIFEPLWNQRYIDHVQITAAEEIGIENRGSYYENAGTLRDMIQNHMLQLLTLVGMEPPVSREANAVRDEKTKVLRAVRPISVEEVSRFAVRGQYTAGSAAGNQVKGYREEKDVKPDSRVETYAAVKLLIDNWRWADVPFYLRSGKRLPKRVSEIAIQFRKVPHLLFKDAAGGRLDPNTLIVRIQPDEGISLKFEAKVPGQTIQIRPVSMDFQYGTSFGKRSPEAYERLLLDAMLGDSTLYARGDMVELSWQLVMPILQAWQQSSDPPEPYEAGTWGPASADKLIENDGRRWRKP
jgi:glucose-6-phosphate 1-dehydrogenase